MKAMTDKSNDTIQVIVTTACNLFNCSNCTQLLPFRKDATHMSPEVFREAVHSLRDWPGIVGIFGGNPCSHPKFPELMKILVEEIPDQKHRGLWSNNLMGHGALVREVFYPYGRFNLNAHAVNQAAKQIEQFLPGKLIRSSGHQLSWHSPILIDHADMGISDEEWTGYLERCDINLNWSGAVAERRGRAYGYFCEVAAAIDGVTGQNTGIPVHDGWWKHKMEVFQEQVDKCCNKCGVPLKMKGQLDRNDTYDVSPSWKAHTDDRKGSVDIVVHDEVGEKTVETTDYMQHRSKR